MKPLLIAAFSLILLPLSAQEKKELSPIERLMQIMKFEDTIIDGGDAGFLMVEQSLAGQDLNKEEMAEVKDAFMAYMRKVASDPELKAKTAALYQKEFTAEEINALIEFYKTPIGKKSLKVMPKLSGEIMGFSQKLAQRHVGSFQEALTAILTRKAARENKENE